MTANTVLSVHVFLCVFLLFWLIRPLAQACDPIIINKTTLTNNKKHKLRFCCAGHMRMTLFVVSATTLHVRSQVSPSRTDKGTEANDPDGKHCVESVCSFILFFCFGLAGPLHRHTIQSKLIKHPPITPEKHICFSRTGHMRMNVFVVSATT
jgi:hypothetical protein